MALLQTQDFEGQTSGTTITAGNSGTAPSTAYTTVNTGTGATIQYDNAHAMHGTNAGKFATAGTSTTVNCLQTFTGVATAYGRFYIYSTDWTSSQQFGMRIRGGGVQAARICFDSTGHVNIHNSGNTAGIATGSVGLSNATWYRVEWSCTPGTSTTGAMTVNVYAGDSLTLLDTCSTTTANLGTAAIDEYGIGLFTSTASVSAFWIDDTNVNDSALPGPAVTTTPISGSDTGSGSDGGEAIAAAASDTETGTGADAGESIVVAVSSADTGTGADGGESIGLADTETGTGVDAGESVAAAITATDTGSGVDAGESVAANLSSADTGTAVDGQSVAVPVGVPFLTYQFGPSSYLLVQAAWGADLTADPATWVWTDITADVYYATKLVITQGRPDNTSQAPAAQCSFTLDNTSGDYTPYSPAAGNFPYVRTNTPIRGSANIGTGETVFFEGRAVGWTPVWDTSANLALVKVVAAGTLRRLGQGKTPLRSPSYRAITKAPVAPYAYWTMEDGSTAVNLASAVTGIAALTIAGAVTLGATAGPGTAASADFSGGGSVSVSLPAQTGTIAWRIAFTFSPQTGTASYVPLHLATTTGTIWEIEFDLSPAGVTLGVGTQVPGSLASIIGPPDIAPWAAGSWHSVVLDAVQTGADMGFILTIDGVAWPDHVAFPSQQLGWITAITLNPTPVFATKTSSAFLAAHLPVWASNPSDDLYNPAIGWAGELPDARLTRICAEENIPLAVTGTADQPMGPQPIDTLLTILRECEATDGGVLFDGFGPGLGYICLSSRYNLAPAITIDAGAGQLSPPFAPVDDDQRIRNDVTANRSTGSSARYIETDGPLGTDTIETYDTSVTVNTDDDTPLLNIAAWNAGLGTVEGLRYPNLQLDFTAVPALAADWIAAADIGFRADIVNIVDKAVQHPPDDVESIVEGFTTTIDQFRWAVAASCSPYEPWQVGEVDDTDTVIDADDATLAVNVPSGTTGTYNVTVGTLWSTDPADYPVNLGVGGEEITCSGVTGGSSPQAFTLSARGVNGVTTAHTTGDPVTVWTPARVAL